MRPPKSVFISCLFAAGIGASGMASAALFSRAGGTMVYDSDQNITWLADVNYAATQYIESCGVLGAENGMMTYPQAQKWVGELVVGGVSGWRLPRSAQPDATCDRQTVVGSHGYGCANSEMGHLFYGDTGHGLGGKAGDSIVKTHNANFDLFQFKNYPTYGVHWTSTDFSFFPFVTRNFEMRSGFSNAYSKSTPNIPWPIHDGDVGLGVKGNPSQSDNRKYCGK